jgi:hypothetical protein
MTDHATNPTPVDPKPAPLARVRRRMNAKQISLWLSVPTAVLVLLNEFTSIQQYFTSSSSSGGKMTVVVEHHDVGNVPADNPGTPALSVEAARFDEQDPNKLDIICRNASSQPVFIREASVELVRVWRLQPVVASRGKLASSANYDLTLPATSAPTQFKKELTQEIPAKGLDRFSITIGPAPSKEAGAKVYQFRLTLLAGEQSTPAGEFLYMIPPSAGTPQPPYAANRTALAELMKTTGTKNTLLTQFLAAAPTE